MYAYVIRHGVLIMISLESNLYLNSGTMHSGDKKLLLIMINYIRKQTVLKVVAAQNKPN